MDTVNVDGIAFEGLTVKTCKAVLLMIKGSKGFLGCGYFNAETADKLSEAVAIVTGVQTYDDMLGAAVIRVSREAGSLGIETGMSGREALKRLA